MRSRTPLLVLAAVALVAAVVVALSTVNPATTPTASPSTAAATGSAVSSAPNVPPELADSVQQADGSWRTPDGRVFFAPDEFGSQPCAEARWPVAQDTVDLAAAAGVPVDPVEWLSHHVHTYVGVFVDGEAEVVPSGIGIDNDGHRIAGLHTHDCSGTVHLEAQKAMQLTLGQFADSWGVKLDGQCFADLCAPGDPVMVQVNGEPVADARSVVVADCDVINVVIGDPPAEFPPAAAEGC
jgi:hypothetical protein